ncbi:MAG: hypothetical protein Q4C46_04025 [Bacillota bacterium]|nr:hypothetical protein [Bacillota bacterium]
MYFIEQEENNKLTQRLESVIKEGRVSHAYILEGPVDAHKKAFAESFVKGILCSRNLGENCGRCSICDKVDHGNCEDVIYISAEQVSIKDADIVKMQERLRTKPFGERNIVIVEGADSMTLRAQNRLLKTLEEPPGKSVIILLSENMENLTQTIQSRCVKYRLNSSSGGSRDFMMEKARKVAVMAFERSAFYRIKEETEDVLKDDEKLSAFLDCLQVTYRDMIVNRKEKISIYKDEDIIKNIHAVEAARRSIRQGVSAAYAVRKLLLTIGG